MKQFNEEEVRIDIPNATIIFPKGFDSQIARVCIYKREGRKKKREEERKGMKEEVRIDIPNATIIFPKGFDRQIARVCIYKKEKGERKREEERKRMKRK